MHLKKSLVDNYVNCILQLYSITFHNLFYVLLQSITFECNSAATATFIRDLFAHDGH